MKFRAKIDKKLPIPPAVGESKGYTEFMRTMKKGESAVFPLKDTSAVNMYAVKAWGKHNYASRKIGKMKIRVWRTR